MAHARHLVYLHVHDLGRHLGTYGAAVRTPALDALAGESLVFEAAHCASPCCSPSRACALSGLHPHRSGAIGLAHMGWPLADAVPTLVDDLAGAGFETILSGINHERHPRSDRYEHDLNRRWEDWNATQAVDNALAALARRDPSRRCFLNLGFQEPHASIWHRFAAVAADPASVDVPAWLPDTPAQRRDLAVFAAAIRHVDAQVDRFLRGLESLGMAGETLLVFTTDHGMTGPRAKGTLYGHGTEIALLLRGPGVAAGRTRALTTNLDFRPTWLDLLGLQPPAGIDGRSFAAVARGRATAGRDGLLISRNFHGERIEPDGDWVDLHDPSRAWRTDRHLLVWNPIPDPRPPAFALGPVPRPEWELFDVGPDPHERVDLARDPAHAALRERLAARLHAELRATGDYLPGPPPPRPHAPGWGPLWPS